MKTTTKAENHKLSLRITRDADKSPVKVLTISIKTCQRACIATARTNLPRHRHFQCNRLLGGR